MVKTALLVTLLIVSGCGTGKAHRMHQGEYLPRSKVAILRDTTNFFFVAYCETRFWSMDGINVRGKRTLELLPGAHEVDFSMELVGYSSASRSGSLKFQAEAGHEYQLKVTNCMSTPRFEPWIEDKTTGKVVAGTRPKKQESEQNT
ncbi:MAG: hypothetical protein GTO40_30205 [Deltaproteobacteria bacterium]|nr:hypothetical protein [Deltaproteobacteria bacterium]